MYQLEKKSKFLLLLHAKNSFQTKINFSIHVNSFQNNRCLLEKTKDAFFELSLLGFNLQTRESCFKIDMSNAAGVLRL